MMTPRDISEIEDALHLPNGFISNLATEDDWSFVVKSHALVESFLNIVLTKRITMLKDCEADVLDVVSRIETSNTRSGKLVLMKALGDVDGDEIRFIRSLSEVRNKLVHRIENIYFTFADEIANLDDKQLILWCKRYDTNGTNKFIPAILEEIRRFPKAYVFAGVLDVLSWLNASIIGIEIDEQNSHINWFNRITGSQDKDAS